MSETYKF